MLAAFDADFRFHYAAADFFRFTLISRHAIIVTE